MPRLTRRHFRVAAAAVASEPDRRSARIAALDLAEQFSKSNPKFNRARFLTACGVEA